jgi:hypothetical protein
MMEIKSGDVSGDIVRPSVAKNLGTRCYPRIISWFITLSMVVITINTSFLLVTGIRDDTGIYWEVIGFKYRSLLGRTEYLR